MPNKSRAPYRGPPRWLDPAQERSLRNNPTVYASRDLFIAACFDALLARGMTPRQCAEVTANAALEASWGRNCHHGNAGGWKITEAFVQSFKASHNGVCPPWWKSPGNVDSADSAWCFYRCFDSLAEFLYEWCEHFIPKPGATAPYPGYKATGAEFWSGSARWFGSMITVGYKGKPSKLRMQALRLVGADDARHPSVRDHRSMAEDILDVWAQSRLGIDPDGAWGPKSRAACREFQLACDLHVTGERDDATLAAMASMAATNPTMPASPTGT